MINVLHLGLSYKCNMNCKHCFVHRRKDRLKEDDYYRIIDTLYDRGLFFVYYTFGEPLLCDYFEKVSGYAKEKRLIQILMTNGSLIDDEKIEIIKKNNISKVCISIDHIEPEKHDANRNHKGAFAKAVSALKLLVAMGIRTEMSVTVNDNNALCLGEIYKMAKENNVDFISYLRERKDGKIVKMKYENSYMEFFESVILQKDVKLLFHDSRLLPVLRKLKDENKIDELTYERYYEMNCCHSQYTMSVAPNGDVLGCNLINMPLGNVFEDSLGDIIENEEEKNENISCCAILSE